MFASGLWKNQDMQDKHDTLWHVVLNEWYLYDKVTKRWNVWLLYFDRYAMILDLRYDVDINQLNRINVNRVLVRYIEMWHILLLANQIKVYIFSRQTLTNNSMWQDHVTRSSMPIRVIPHFKTIAIYASY